jgi:hypothetical protein
MSGIVNLCAFMSHLRPSASCTAPAICPLCNYLHFSPRHSQTWLEILRAHISNVRTHRDEGAERRSASQNRAFCASRVVHGYCCCWGQIRRYRGLRFSAAVTRRDRVGGKGDHRVPDRRCGNGPGDDGRVGGRGRCKPQESLGCGPAFLVGSRLGAVRLRAFPHRRGLGSFHGPENSDAAH